MKNRENEQWEKTKNLAQSYIQKRRETELIELPRRAFQSDCGNWKESVERKASVRAFLYQINNEDIKFELDFSIIIIIIFFFFLNSYFWALILWREERRLSNCGRFSTQKIKRKNCDLRLIKKEPTFFYYAFWAKQKILIANVGNDYNGT